jgi:transcriptional regulator with XRE-family HTH domain
MTPVNPELFDYEFDASSIRKIRDELGINQGGLAEMLDVPLNTVSRWEKGENAPDAKKMAALYSVAKKNNLLVDFFKQRKEAIAAKQKRTKLVLAWDFQSIPVDEYLIHNQWVYMETYLNRLFLYTRLDRNLLLYKGMESDVKETADKIGFQVKEGQWDADSQLMNDVRTLCNDKPAETVFILVTRGGDYTSFLRELIKAGVDVYIWSDDQLDGAIKKVVADDHFIYWSAPYVLMKCLEVFNSLNGKKITRKTLDDLCKKALDREGIYPQDAGFSKRRPYVSVLSWLEQHALVEVETVGDEEDSIIANTTIKEVGMLGESSLMELLGNLRGYLKTDTSISDEGHYTVTITNTAPQTTEWPKVVFMGVGLSIANFGAQSYNEIVKQLKGTIVDPEAKSQAIPTRKTGTIRQQFKRGDGSSTFPDATPNERTFGHVLFPGQSAVYEFDVIPKDLPYIDLSVESTVSRRHLFHTSQEINTQKQYSAPLLASAIEAYKKIDIHKFPELIISSIHEVGPDTSISKLQEYETLISERIPSEIEETQNKLREISSNWRHSHLRVLTKTTAIYFNHIKMACENLKGALMSHDIGNIQQAINEVKKLRSESGEVDKVVQEIIDNNGLSVN